MHHHAGRKTCVSPDTTFQGFPPSFHQGLPSCEEFHHKESMALNTQQGKDNLNCFYIVCLSLCAPKTIFFFDNMKLPTLPVVIYWNSLDNVPNQLFLLISFVSFYSIFISYERKRKNSYNCFFPYSSWSFSFRVICEGLRTVWCSIEIVEPIIKSFRI